MMLTRFGRIFLEYDVLKLLYPILNKLIEYILNNLFEGPKHFLTIGNRTNNHLEGYNQKGAGLSIHEIVINFYYLKREKLNG